jgi:hypothetical protein
MPRHAVLGDLRKEHKSGVGTEKWIFLRTEGWYSTRKRITHLGVGVARLKLSTVTVAQHCSPVPLYPS